jgi:putative PIN family toxin of toxin-antitoxin system
MRIVIDTNVLVAGLLSPFGPYGEMVRMVSSGGLTLCLDARILSEYSEVLNRPRFRFEKEKVIALLDHIEYRGRIVASSPLPHSLPDPDDTPFLEVALSGDAKYLVTGNQAHFPPERCRGVKVLSPSDFLKHYAKRKKKDRE